jgi:hypothetical protein
MQTIFSNIGYTIDRFVFDLHLQPTFWYIFPLIFFSIFFHLCWPIWILFLGIPYLTVWALYLIFGQKDNPNRSKLFGFAIPALPLEIVRVYAVNRELLLFIRSFFSAKSNEIIRLQLKADYGFDLKAALDIPFGNNGSQLDVYESQGVTTGFKPVICFFQGAGWNGCYKSFYSPIARTFCERGYVVVIPDYIYWPKGNAKMILDDVNCALKWTLKNIKCYNGDPTNITVIAHGNGAHLVSTAVIKSAINCIESVTRNVTINHRDSMICSNELRKLKGLIL